MDYSRENQQQNQETAMLGGTGGEYGYGDLSSSNINNHMPSSNDLSNNQLPHSS
jgi:hypothetical protein